MGLAPGRSRCAGRAPLGHLRLQFSVKLCRGGPRGQTGAGVRKASRTALFVAVATTHAVVQVPSDPSSRLTRLALTADSVETWRLVSSRFLARGRDVRLVRLQR